MKPRDVIVTMTIRTGMTLRRLRETMGVPFNGTDLPEERIDLVRAHFALYVVPKLERTPEDPAYWPKKKRKGARRASR